MNKTSRKSGRNKTNTSRIYSNVLSFQNQVSPIPSGTKMAVVNYQEGMNLSNMPSGRNNYKNHTTARRNLTNAIASMHSGKLINTNIPALSSNLGRLKTIF